MKMLIVAAVVAVLIAPHARAAVPEVSADTKQALAYGYLALTTNVCKTPLTPGQTAEINTGFQKALEAQQEMTPEAVATVMNVTKALIIKNLEHFCSTVTPDVVAKALKDAAAGQ